MPETDFPSPESAGKDFLRGTRAPPPPARAPGVGAVPQLVAEDGQPRRETRETKQGRAPVRAGRGARARRRERARLSSANGNASGIYGPNLRSVNSGGVGVNHFTIKIYVFGAKD